MIKSNDVMKRLVLDIETSPNVGHVWGTKNQFLGLNQIQEWTRMLSVAAKWHDKKQVMFFSEFHNGHDEMVQNIWTLIDEADVLIHFNGKRFDMGHLRREFLLQGLGPTSPVQEIDLFQVAKQFRFVSLKLEHLLNQLDLGGKVHHTGHQLWTDCLAGDPKAWALMKKYNIGDVVQTEKLYDRLLPWIHNHPNMQLYNLQEGTCPTCGGTNHQKRGTRKTNLTVFQAYSCNDCGRRFQGKRALHRAEER